MKKKFQLQRNLQACPEGSGAGVLFILAVEPKADNRKFIASDVIEIILSDEFGETSNHKEYLIERLALSESEIQAVADNVRLPNSKQVLQSGPEYVVFASPQAS